MTGRAYRLQRAKGITLLEVMIAAACVAVVVAAITNAMMTSMMSTQQSGEYIAVQLAARQKMEEISACRFDNIVDIYRQGGTIGNTFDVYKTTTNGGTKIKLGGLPDQSGAQQPAGEVIIITNENAPASSYGRDLSPFDGQPDGCQFVGLPMDLNGNGTTADGNVWGPTSVTRTAIRFPVGIVIRWPGVRGQERYELWTILSKY